MVMLAAVLACALQDPDKVIVTLEVQDAPLAQAIQMLRTISKVPIEVDEAARKALDFDKEQVSASLKDLPLSAALKLLVLPRGLDVKVVDQKKIVLTVPK